MNFVTTSRIEYLTHRWNIFSGCTNKPPVCQVADHCWAHAEVQKHPERYPYGWQPHFYPGALPEVQKLQGPGRVGVAFGGDLFCDPDLPHQYVELQISVAGQKPVPIHIRVSEALFMTIRDMPAPRFLFLTKNIRNALHWGTFPSNAWVGATCTDLDHFCTSMLWFPDVACLHRWISFEPVYHRIIEDKKPPDASMLKLDWAVFGAQTKPLVKVPPENIAGMVILCDLYHIPVFLKRNIWSSLPKAEPFFRNGAFRQEYPKDLELIP